MTRYLDLFVRFHSIYNTVMKIVFISISSYVCILMQTSLKNTYDKRMDNFKIEYLIGVAAFVAMIFHYQRDNVVLEVVVVNSDSMGIFYIS